VSIHGSWVRFLKAFKTDL